MQVTFQNGDPVGFVILQRDKAELHLTLVKSHRASIHNVAHLMVADATGLHDHLAAHDVRILRGSAMPTTGCAGFVFADPADNRIDVGEQR